MFRNLQFEAFFWQRLYLPGTQLTPIPRNKAFFNQNKGHLGSRCSIELPFCWGGIVPKDLNVLGMCWRELRFPHSRISFCSWWPSSSWIIRRRPKSNIPPWKLTYPPQKLIFWFRRSVLSKCFLFRGGHSFVFGGESNELFFFCSADGGAVQLEALWPRKTTIAT